MNKKLKLQGLVASVLIATEPKTLLSAPRDEITVTMEGCLGDKHAGLTRLSDSRTPQYKRGTVIRNSRQVSLVSLEELASVAQAMELPALPAEWLGANLVLRNVPHLTQLPPATRLYFPDETVLVVEGENFPCNQPGRIIQSQHPTIPNLGAAFLKFAMHHRGLVAWVERAGQIRPSDTVNIEVPPPPPFYSFE